MFQNDDVRFHVVHGDMTSDWSVSGTNAIKTVHNYIQMEIERYGFKKKDIINVIHLVDTDGTFIPPDKIVFGATKEIQYFDDRIESTTPENIVGRNERKSLVLRRLYSTGKVSAIPYSVYYFSRNLEHVLHNNNTNLTDGEKTKYADAFADKYKFDCEGFQTFISSSDFTVPGKYMDTWSFIMQDINSLHRHSNFHLLFQKNEQE